MNTKECIKNNIVEVIYGNFEIYKDDLKILLLENMIRHLDAGKIDEDYFEAKTIEIKKYLYEKKAVIFLYLIDDSVKGCIWAYPKTFLNEQRLFVQLLQVHSDSRNFGIGRKLLETIENYAKKNKYDAVDMITSANNDGAMRFYQREGYKIERVQLLKELD